MENNRGQGQQQLPVPTPSTELPLPVLDAPEQKQPAQASKAPEAPPVVVDELEESSEVVDELDQLNDPTPAPLPPADVKPVKKTPIKVRALADGFFRNKRIPKGKEFFVYEENLGSWMKVLDNPAVDQRHTKAMKANQEKIRQYRLKQIKQAGN